MAHYIILGQKLKKKHSKKGINYREQKEKRKHKQNYFHCLNGCHFFRSQCTQKEILMFVNTNIIVLIFRFVMDSSLHFSVSLSIRIPFHCLPFQSCQKLAQKTLEIRLCNAHRRQQFNHSHRSLSGRGNAIENRPNDRLPV